MTDEMFRAVVEVAGAKLDAGGDAALPDRHLLTLHIAHDGASMSIGRLTRVSLRDGVITAEDDKGELFVAALADAFAATISAPSGGASRKAGFIR